MNANTIHGGNGKYTIFEADSFVETNTRIQFCLKHRNFSFQCLSNIQFPMQIMKFVGLRYEVAFKGICRFI